MNLSEPFGHLPDGRLTRLYTLRHRNGFEARITDYGATLVSVLAPDRNGRYGEVVLGLPNARAYVSQSCYLGAIVGRVANRIAAGRFLLDGREYHLACNNAPSGVPCHLHGGTSGFDRKIWTAEPSSDQDQPSLRLKHISPAGDEGYPGNMEVEITYTLLENHALRLDFTARVDQASPVNLTSHPYFNLQGTGSVLDHELQIFAEEYTPITPGLIPTGEVCPVAGTPLDFTHPCRIGERIGSSHAQILAAAGYDHNFVLTPIGKNNLRLAARVHEPNSGRLLEVHTTAPGLHFYSGNYLDIRPDANSGCTYSQHGGFCLEAQGWPDAVNQTNFPSVILRPGQTYRESTVYEFSVSSALE